MNLQTMTIILIIIVLPITLVLSAYTKIQIDTIAEQTMLRTKLKDATYDAIVAFQINTVHNTYSTVSDSMRRDISAVIQTFIKDLATNLGVSGKDETEIKPYIPAIVFTLYDGYYIYSPSISHTQNGDATENQSEKTTYEHVLKPYIYYTARYKNGNVDVVINYSLDNYIVVTGFIGTQYVTNAGYLVNPDIKMQFEDEILERRLPVTTITFEDNEQNKSFVKNVTKFSTDVVDMIVTNEEGMKADRLTNGNLLTSTSVFKNPYQLSVNQGIAGNRSEINKLSITRELLQEELEKAKNPATISTAKGNILKKWYTPMYNFAGNITEEKFTTGDYTLGYYVDPSTDAYYIQPDSAKQYYENAIKFTNWVNNNLGSIKASDAIKSDGSHYEGFSSSRYIFQIGSQNDPDDEASIFNDHRREIIKQSIQDNLSQAISSYNENSENYGTLANFQMPILTEDEWNQVLHNVCLITFMQGRQVGTKMFNDYCIVTSTRNKEYVSKDAIYYINPDNENTDEPNYYHKIDCPYLDDSKKIVGYRNSDFDRMNYEVENEVNRVNVINDKIQEINYSEKDKKYYYYMHPEYACYYCIVNHSSEKRVDWRKSPERLKAYYTAMAREKYNFYKTNSYFRIGNE